MSDDQAARAEPVRAPRLGLSGKLLVFTILFVMIAEVLIYVPSIALYRLMWLNDRLASAYTAALVLDAAPNGMVPASQAKQILDSIGARALARARSPGKWAPRGACPLSGTRRRRSPTISTCATSTHSIRSSMPSRS